MMDNQHEVVISANQRFVGTGHNSEIITDEEDTDWVFYHAVDRQKPQGRVLMLSPLTWVDGWPMVQKQSMSDTKPLQRPVFNK